MDIKQTFTNIFSFPGIHSLLFTAAGGVVALGNGSTEEITLLPALGLTADGINYATAKLALGNWSRQSEVNKVVGEEYLDAIINMIRAENGYQGSCLVSEKQAFVQGTSTHTGNGYFKEVYFNFADGEVKLFYKYAAKSNTPRGALLGSALHNQRVSFVPRVLVPAEQQFVHNEYDFNGTFFEFVEGATIEEEYTLGRQPNCNQTTLGVVVDNLFSALSAQVYSNGQLSDESHLSSSLPAHQNLEVTAHLFHRKLVERVSDKEKFLHFNLAMDFLCELDRAYSQTMETIQLSLVSGDLHQSNVLVRDGVVNGIVDWDNGQLCHPYLDFYHFSIISDFERDSTFTAQSQAFLDRHPLQDTQKKLIEFEVALSLLNRYYGAYCESLFDPPENDKIIASCRYLLEKADQSMKDYVALTKNHSLERSYETYTRFAYEQLAAVDFDPNASVAYLHRVNHETRVTNHEFQARENAQKHVQEQEKIFYATRKATFIAESAGNALAVAALGTVGDSLLNDYYDVLPPELLPMSLMMICISSYSKQIGGAEKMLNYLSNVLHGRS